MRKGCKFDVELIGIEYQYSRSSNKESFVPIKHDCLNKKLRLYDSKLLRPRLASYAMAVASISARQLPAVIGECHELRQTVVHVFVDILDLEIHTLEHDYFSGLIRTKNKVEGDLLSRT